MIRMQKFVAAAGVLLAAFSLLGASDPYIGYVYPSGGEVGRTVRLLIGGQNLGVNQGLISGDGVAVKKITPVPGFPPPDGQQRKYLLDWIKAIENRQPKPPLPDKANVEEWRKNAWWEKLDTLDRLELNLVIRDLYAKRNALQATPSLRQMLIVDLEIAPDAAPGRRELRLWGGRGISNPKDFFVDTARHTAEPWFSPPGKPVSPMPKIEQFPAVLDGQIMPGQTDHFMLKLEKDRPVDITLLGRELQPFIGDAVPGFFQPVLELFDDKNQSVAYADDHYFNPDPVLTAVVSETGWYRLDIRDNLYRGREDFVYRVVLSTGLTESPWDKSPFAGIPIFQEESLAERKLEFAPMTEPVVISGALSKPGERDQYRFRGYAGETLVLELAARQLGSPLDGVLVVRDASGRIVARGDDAPAPRWNIGTVVQYADPKLLLKLPAPGSYTVTVEDLTGQGGDACRYYLKLAPPQPDFAVYSGTSMTNIPAGGTGTIKLYVMRQDGCAAPLSVSSTTKSLEIISGAQIAGNADSVEVTVKNRNALRAPPEMLGLEVRGAIGSRMVRHKVIPADEYMQAFAYNHLIPARYWYLGTMPPERGNRNPGNPAGKRVPAVNPKPATP